MTGFHMKGKQPHHVAVCTDCGKRSYGSKADAKRAGKMHDRGLRPYRCPTNDSWWHLGHLARDVLHGKLGRDIYREGS